MKTRHCDLNIGDTDGDGTNEFADGANCTGFWNDQTVILWRDKTRDLPDTDTQLILNNISDCLPVFAE